LNSVKLLLELCNTAGQYRPAPPKTHSVGVLWEF